MASCSRSPIGHPRDAAAAYRTADAAAHTPQLTVRYSAAPSPRSLARIGSFSLALAGEEGIPRDGGRAEIRSAPVPCGAFSPHVFLLIAADAEATVGMGTGMLPGGKAVGLLGT